MFFLKMIYTSKTIERQESEKEGVPERGDSKIWTSLSSGFTCELLIVVPCCTFCLVFNRGAKNLRDSKKLAEWSQVSGEMRDLGHLMDYLRIKYVARCMKMRSFEMRGIIGVNRPCVV